MADLPQGSAEQVLPKGLLNFTDSTIVSPFVSANFPFFSFFRNQFHLKLTKVICILKSMSNKEFGYDEQLLLI
jgi:hypothetical protein